MDINSKMLENEKSGQASEEKRRAQGKEKKYVLINMEFSSRLRSCVSDAFAVSHR